MILSGWFRRASRIDRCSAWIQHVLSVTFLWYPSFEQPHLLCDSRLFGGVLYHIPIHSSHAMMMHPHFDRSQVALRAIFAA